MAIWEMGTHMCKSMFFFMIEEQESIKNAEAAKRQRDLRKYGKKVQTEKCLISESCILKNVAF